MIIEFSSALTALASSVQILKTLKKDADANVVSRAIHRLSAVQRTVLVNNEKLLEYSERINALTAENNTLKAKLADRDNHVAVNIARQSGDVFWAMVKKPDSGVVEDSSEPKQYLCQSCFNHGKKSLLSFANFRATCEVCKTSLEANPKGRSEPISTNMRTATAQSKKYDPDS